MSASIRVVVKDANGITFDPTSLAHQYRYDTNGNMLTDTCIEQRAIVRQKTYTYEQIGESWLVQTESAWIVLDAEAWAG